MISREEEEGLDGRMDRKVLVRYQKIKKIIINFIYVETVNCNKINDHNMHSQLYTDTQ